MFTSFRRLSFFVCTRRYSFLRKTLRRVLTPTLPDDMKVIGPKSVSPCSLYFDPNKLFMRTSAATSCVITSLMLACAWFYYGVEGSLLIWRRWLPVILSEVFVGTWLLAWFCSTTVSLSARTVFCFRDSQDIWQIFKVRTYPLSFAQFTQLASLWLSNFLYVNLKTLSRVLPSPKASCYGRYWVLSGNRRRTI